MKKRNNGSKLGHFVWLIERTFPFIYSVHCYRLITLVLYVLKGIINLIYDYIIIPFI